MSDSDNIPIKVILLGESGVGKTNLIRVAAGKKFDPRTEPTLANSYCESQTVVNNKKYRYLLWDTAGQEQFRSMNQLFIKDSKIIIIVFAINSKKSFTLIDYWYKYVKDQLGEKGYIVSLVGNKSDLFDEDNTVKDNEIIEKAKELGIKFKVTSALADADGFRRFLDEILEEYINKYYNNKEFQKQNSFRIKSKEDNQNNKEKKKCCEAK